MATRRDSRTKEQLLAEIDFLRRGGWAAQVGPTVRYLTVAAAAMVIAWFAKEAVVGVAVAFAGKTTNANVAMRLIQDLNVSISLAWAVGISGVGYGWRQRKLRKETTERLSERIKRYEEQIDPSRTTSSLTPQGDTNPKDRA
jgi:hypothetical protein